MTTAPTPPGDRPPCERISVVIPVFDQAEELDLQLAAVTAQDVALPVEILVADNGSRDATPDVIRRWEQVDDRVRGVDASARRGPAAARNIAVETASGDLLAFCDADDIVAPGWLAALLAAIQDADAAAGALDLGTLNGGGRTVSVAEYSGQFAFLPGGLGANLAVRSSVFRSTGGFDETLHAGEDIDFSWRLQLAGGRLVPAPDAVVAKRERGSKSELRHQILNYGRHDPALFSRFRGAGMRRNNRLTVKTYAWLLLNGPRALLRPARRDEYLRALFLRAGRLRGSVTYRVFYP